MSLFNRSVFFLSMTFFISCFAIEPVILLCGCPGAGKGTFSEYAQRHGYQHLSVGDTVRKEIADRTERGLKWESIVKAGEFIDQDEIDELLFEQISCALQENPKLIIDAYVRSADSVHRITSFFAEIDQLKNCCAVIIDASDEICSMRIQHRLVCNQCNKIFNNSLADANQNCPACLSGRVEKRLGDAVENIRKRIDHYRRNIEPSFKPALRNMPCYQIATDGPIENLTPVYENLLR
jgi:adenylate kinase